MASPNPTMETNTEGTTTTAPSSEPIQPTPGVAAGLSSREVAEVEKRSASIPVASTPQTQGQVTTQTSTQAASVTFSAPLLKYLKLVASGTLALSPAQSQEITSSVQDTSNTGPPDLSRLLSYLSTPSNYAQSPLPTSANDLTKPLSWYFNSSSHNTYLSGNQLYGEASGQAYENVLKRGCRCVEIDVWDGEETREDRERERERREEREKSKDQSHGLGSMLRSEGEGLKSKLAERLHRYSPSADSTKDDAKQSHSRSHSHTRSNEKGNSATMKSFRAEPRVLHGFTLTKDVSFREVCEAIRDSAFANSDLPVIVSLEVHAGATQQEIMVEIMQECWAGMLVEEDTRACMVLPTPEQLKGKILVKVKGAPLATEGGGEAVVGEEEEEDEDGSESSDEEKKLRKTITTSSTLSTTSSGTTKQSRTMKKTKKSVIPALSALAKYTQAFHFKDLQSREAVVPTHVFSLSEKKVMTVHGAASGPSIFSHNKNFLMRAFPAGTRLDSSNLDPAVFWRKGVQMVALNWQKFDAGTMMNEAQFAGSGGWLLKPEGYHGSLTGETKIGSESQVDAMPRKPMQLSITLLAAQGLPMKKSQDKGGRLSPYIKCELHVERPEEVTRQPIAKDGHATEGEYKLRSKNSKTADPDFLGEVLKFPQVHIVEELSFIRFKIMDDVLGRDNLLAWSCIRVDRLREGFRLVDLLSADGAECDAVLLIKIDKGF